MNTFDEESAWRRAEAGDPDAFGGIFDAHSNRVYRHALRLTADVHDAQDVVAATFLELWRRRRHVRLVDGSVVPWLLVTAGNLALNHGRGRRRHRAFVARLPRTEGVVEGADVHALLRVDLDVDPLLLAQIRSLGAADRQLLALVALEGYPLRAAAEALGLTEQAARSRWQRLRKRLAESRPADPSPLVVRALTQETSS